MISETSEETNTIKLLSEINKKVSKIDIIENKLIQDEVNAIENSKKIDVISRLLNELKESQK